MVIRFETSEKVRGVLIPLQVVVDRLSFLDVVWWAFREIELGGMDVPDRSPVWAEELERLSNLLSKGFVVSDADFRSMIKTGYHLTYGFVDVYAASCDRLPCVTIEAVDSSFWVITTTSREVATQIARCGLGVPVEE